MEAQGAPQGGGPDGEIGRGYHRHSRSPLTKARHAFRYPGRQHPPGPRHPGDLPQALPAGTGRVVRASAVDRAGDETAPIGSDHAWTAASSRPTPPSTRPCPTATLKSAKPTAGRGAGAARQGRDHRPGGTPRRPGPPSRTGPTRGPAGGFWPTPRPRSKPAPKPGSPPNSRTTKPKSPAARHNVKPANRPAARNRSLRKPALAPRTRST